MEKSISKMSRKSPYFGTTEKRFHIFFPLAGLFNLGWVLTDDKLGIARRSNRLREKLNYIPFFLLFIPILIAQSDFGFGILFWALIFVIALIPATIQMLVIRPSERYSKKKHGKISLDSVDFLTD